MSHCCPHRSVCSSPRPPWCSPTHQTGPCSSVFALMIPSTEGSFPGSTMVYSPFIQFLPITSLEKSPGLHSVQNSALLTPICLPCFTFFKACIYLVGLFTYCLSLPLRCKWYGERHCLFLPCISNRVWHIGAHWIFVEWINESVKEWMHDCLPWVWGVGRGRETQAWLTLHRSVRPWFGHWAMRNKEICWFNFFCPGKVNDHR